MERDYWKLREVETRYRLLFDASNEAVLVLSPEDLRVVEANPAAIRALGLTRGWEFLSEIAPAERDAFRAMLAGVRETGRAPGGVFHLGHRHAAYILRASLMNAESAALYMVQLVPVATPGQQVAPPVNLGSGPLASLLERLPDGFVVLDREGVVQRANRAFLDMVQIGTETAVLGQRLDRWIRRPGADTGRLLANLRRHGSVRMFEITIEGQHGASVEVEVSATGDADADPLFVGIVLRDLSRRQCPANDAAALPTQLFAPLAAATPLRELVQRSVSLVERHYIESALQATEGNRTAAAELLGLSRQSLYAKLGRYGL
jgi:transcriptional regulator PpsR